MSEGTYYYPLFEHMSQQHGLTLVDDELHQIARVVEGLPEQARREAALLALMLHYEWRKEAPMHLHNVFATWDDNGLPCGKCKAWAILRDWAVEIQGRVGK